MYFGIVVYPFAFESWRTLLVLDNEDQHQPPKSLSYRPFHFYLRDENPLTKGAEQDNRKENNKLVSRPFSLSFPRTGKREMYRSKCV